MYGRFEQIMRQFKLDEGHNVVLPKSIYSCVNESFITLFDQQFWKIFLTNRCFEVNILAIRSKSFASKDVASRPML